MEERLRPVNALLGLVTGGDVNPPALGAVGFRLVGLEVPVIGSGGAVSVDVILLREPSNHLLVCEAKSGANIEEAQALRYAALDPAAVVQAGHITLPHRDSLTLEAVYVCLGEHSQRIQQGIRATGTSFPVLAVYPNQITLVNPDRASAHLGAAFQEGSVQLPASPVRLIPFDHDSPIETIEDFVKPALVAALSRRAQQLTIGGLTERVTPYYGLYGRKARSTLSKKVSQAVAKLAAEEPSTFAYDPPTANRDGLVRLLKTPEDNDTRGRTQAYQALARRGHTRRRKPQQVDPNQLDLLSELDEVEDYGNEDEDPREEESP